MLSRGAGLLLGGFLVAQFIRPALPSGPVTADLQAPAPVKEVLRNSCYNCHSNETRLPWFDRIVPAYWIAVTDVKNARRKVNFSNFDALPAAQQRAILFEGINQVRFGAMPPAPYRLIHPESRVAAGQMAVIEQYLTQPEGSPAATEIRHAADEQYDRWLQSGATSPAVHPAPNGIAFLPDYRNWQAISSTDRFDNHSLRVILANPVAMAAVKAGRVNPWPDGTTFAKVAWEQLPDEAGNVRPGLFLQVEFMIKDAAKYASTKGWGWARWKGAGLKPYGTDAAFSEECIGCHAPLRDSDFVFTAPIARAGASFPPSPLLNRSASLTGSLPFDALQWKVISAGMTLQDGVMDTLYGNDVAVSFARSKAASAYPDGAVLALVTWFRQPDGRWFGARIPGPVKSVEFVTVSAGSRSYVEFAGSPLRKDTTASSRAGSRIDFILGRHAAVMP